MKIKYLVLGVILCLGLAQCAKDAPPPAGSMMAEDPVASGLYQEAKSLIDNGKGKQARKKLEILTEDHPLAVETPEALLLTGDLWLQEGEPVEAFDSYKKMLENYPNSPLYASGMKRLENLAFDSADGKTKYNLFWVFSTSVDTSKVVEMLTAVKENAPHAASAPRAQLKIGEVYERIGNNEKAVEAYHKVVDDYPRSAAAPFAQYSVGRNHLKRVEEGSKNQSHLRYAQEAYEDFLQRYPRHELASKAKEDLNNVRYRLAAMNLDIARFYLKTGNRESAIFYFQDAAHDPYNGEVRGQALTELKSLGVEPKNPRQRVKPAPVRSTPAVSPENQG